MYDISRFIADIQNSSGYWEEMAMLDFAVMLNEEMKNQEISSSQLAKKVSVSKSYISKILGGENINFTLRSMAKFMFAMGKRLHFYCTPLSQEKHAEPNEVFNWSSTTEKSPRSPMSLPTLSDFATHNAENNITFSNARAEKASLSDEDRIAA